MLKNLFKNINEVEDGFSLIELVVAAGISTTLAGVAVSTLIPAATHITENIKEAQAQQAAADQAQLDAINALTGN